MARLCEFPGLIVPQARGLGDEIPPTFPDREAMKEKSSQGAKRHLTVASCEAFPMSKARNALVYQIEQKQTAVRQF